MNKKDVDALFGWIYLGACLALSVMFLIIGIVYQNGFIVTGGGFGTLVFIGIALEGQRARLNTWSQQLLDWIIRPSTERIERRRLRYPEGIRQLNSGDQIFCRRETYTETPGWTEVFKVVEWRNGFIWAELIEPKPKKPLFFYCFREYLPHNVTWETEKRTVAN